MSRSAYDSLISPGPPLPKSHPSPAVIAKLYIHVESSYSSARSLAKTHSEGDVSSDLRKYLANEATVALGLAHKWLGVDAGESGSRSGHAVAFLELARNELEGLKDAGKKVSLGKGSDNQKPKRNRIANELESVTTFLKNYQKLNDTVRRSGLFLPFSDPACSFRCISNKFHISMNCNLWSQAGDQFSLLNLLKPHDQYLDLCFQQVHNSSPTETRHPQIITRAHKAHMLVLDPTFNPSDIFISCIVYYMLPIYRTCPDWGSRLGYIIPSN